jgi:hypothetical protein
MTTFDSEAVPNLMPFGHAANAIELDDGRMFVTWFCGSYEGSEDQRIAGTFRTPDGHWQSPHIVVDRFEYEGDTWMPETSVPIATPQGRLQLAFWACPLSGFRMVENPGIIRIAGGWGGGSWFPYPTVSYTEPKWTRNIATSRVFLSQLGPDFKAQNLQVFTEERGLVLYGAVRKLQSGRWVLPYHTEREESWFRTRFFVSDHNQENWESKADLFSEPGCLEPVVVQQPSGDILCYMRNGGFDGHIWYAASSDDCGAFSEPKQTNLRNPHAGIDIGWSKVSNRLLIVYNDSYRQRTPLCVGISDDKGMTFLTKDVESGLGAFAYPKLLQDRNGLWHLFYTHDYRHIQHVSFEEEWLETGRHVVGEAT